LLSKSFICLDAANQKYMQYLNILQTILFNYLTKLELKGFHNV